MKKNLMVAAVALTCGSMAGTAGAASSVTLYGILDAGISYASNQGGDHNLFGSSGNLSGNRWGLKGSEDLGGGLSAVFRLESGFELFNGYAKQGGRMFGRQAYVGLHSDDFGTVTAGRQDDSINDFLAPLTLNGGGGVGIVMHPYDNDNTNTSFRVNNTLKYMSNAYRGFTFGGLYGFSQEAGDFSDNNAYSFGMTYKNAGVELAAAYLQANRAGGALGAINGGSPLSNFLGAQGMLNQGDAISSYRQRTFGAGGSYVFSDWKLAAIFTHSGFDRAQNQAGYHSLKFNNYEVNATYRMSPALAVRGMYAYTTARVGLNDDRDSTAFHTFGLQSDYSLSKRTTFYVAAAYQRTSDDYKADLYGGSPSANNSQFGLTTGIKHLF
jgi:GBP family porin